ncbi:MAG: sulfatase-like hydrolase/transferase, partial [Candidatus Marinimicrobia bacterium]|nr:sulfatase-like hydrolase/transferase [Candidatus Neomarinimicrobiota bacterium]
MKQKYLLFSIVFILVLELFQNFLLSQTFTFTAVLNLFRYSPLYFAGYILVYIFAILAIGLIPMFRSRFLYYSALFLFLISVAFNFGYIFISEKPFHLLDLNLLVNEIHIHWVHVVKEYFVSISIALILGIITVLTWIYIRRKSCIRIANSWSIALLLSFFSVLFIQYKTAATFQPPLPAMLNIPAFSFLWQSFKPYMGDRDKLSELPQRNPDFQNIVWIVDCSVNGDFISINNTDWNTTPFLQSIKNKMVNRGVVSSVTNCSATTNIFLLGLGGNSQIPDTHETLLKSPNIFTFAKRAGYKTAYLSAQSNNRKLHNFMTKYDVEDIDYFHQPLTQSERSPVLADSELARHLKTYLTHNDSSFIYVLKSGVHFPWYNNYPQNYTLNDSSQMESMGDKTTQYFNALNWKTDRFFQILFEDGTISENTLFIYTSDHGQIVKEEGNYLTHCNTHNPEIEEGKVPLFYLSDNLSTVSNYLSTVKPNNHAEIITLTLHLMGYDAPVKES